MPATPAADPTRLYDRSFVLMTLSQTCFVLGNTLMSHYARWVKLLGGDVAAAGWVSGAGAIVGLLLRPWMGLWINRLGAVRMCGLGYLIFAAGSLGNLWLHELSWLIYVLRSSVVLGAAFVFASSLTYVTQMCPPDRRTEAIGILGAGGFLGMIFGPYLGDFLLGSGSRTRSDFETLFWVMSAVQVPAIGLLFGLQRPPPHAASSVRLREFVVVCRRHWPGPILLVNLAFGLCMTMPFVFLADFVDHARLQLPRLSVFGTFFLAYAGWGLCVRVGLRRLPDRIGRRKVLLAGLLVFALGMFAFLSVDADHTWRIFGPAVLCGTGHALVFHTMTSLAMESFPPHVRGTASTLSLMMLDLGTIGGAPLLGRIANELGYRWLFIMIGMICVLVSAIYAWSSVPVWRDRWQRRRQSGATAEPR